MKKKETKEEAVAFYLPTYKEIPSVGLYLDQTSKYINECLTDLPDVELTNSMISNYVKKHLIANPIKKQYGRDQIACLLFIALTKNALTLDDVAGLFELQKSRYSIEESYVFFAENFNEAYNDFENFKNNETEEKGLLKDVILNVVSNFRLRKKLSDTLKEK